MSFHISIRGSGRSAHAIKEALAILQLGHPELEIGAVETLARHSPLKAPKVDGEIPVLILCSPHALHAPEIIEGAAGGFRAIFTEKPAAVTLEQMRSLRDLKCPAYVFHVYRETWGLQTLGRLIADGELGDLFSIEGRYWQSSSAERARTGQFVDNWKNDPSLSGPGDASLDLAVHWLDAAFFLAGVNRPVPGVWTRAYANGEAPHRDTHDLLLCKLESGLTINGSISKTAHGFMNEFEIHVHGTKGSAAWTFGAPDEIMLGHGHERRLLRRNTNEYGSGKAPFHGLGWIEGYIEILKQGLRELQGFGTRDRLPDLKSHLTMLESLFNFKPL